MRLAFLFAPLLILLGCSGPQDPGQPIVVEAPAPDPDHTTDPEPAPEPEAPPDTEPAEPPPEMVVGDAPCESDADCVPGGCCHPASCVARADAPTCEDVMCTADCRVGTLDCGGGCLCHEGRCAARLMQPPNLQVQQP